MFQYPSTILFNAVNARTLYVLNSIQSRYQRVKAKGFQVLLHICRTGYNPFAFTFNMSISISDKMSSTAYISFFMFFTICIETIHAATIDSVSNEALLNRLLDLYQHSSSFNKGQQATSGSIENHDTGTDSRSPSSGSLSDRGFDKGYSSGGSPFSSPMGDGNGSPFSAANGGGAFGDNGNGSPFSALNGGGASGGSGNGNPFSASNGGGASGGSGNGNPFSAANGGGASGGSGNGNSFSAANGVGASGGSGNGSPFSAAAGGGASGSGDKGNMAGPFSAAMENKGDSGSGQGAGPFSANMGCK